MITIGVLCLVAACALLLGQALQNSRAEKQLEVLRQTAEASKESLQASPGNADTAESSDATEDTDAANSSEDASATQQTEVEDADDASIESELPQEDTPAAVPNPYADVFASYEDIAAWLVVPGTIIDYPVVWTPEDENQYLYLDIDGNEDKNGCLILDTDSSVAPVSTNLIIHGHNMRSGAMFGNLTDYEDRSFCEEHKQITLYTEECQRNYEVIAVFRSQVYKKKDEVFKYYKFFQADTQEEFEDFYQNIKKLSLYDTGVTAEFGDRFITLSTCVYHVEQGRFVVVAKEVEGGDSYLPVQE